METKKTRLRKKITSSGYSSIPSNMPMRILVPDFDKKIVDKDEIEKITYGPNINREFEFERPIDNPEWSLQTDYTKNI